MKQYVELYLVVILVVLLYFRPGFLGNLVNNVLGKLILLGGVIYLAHNHGISSGMLGAIIMILLIHNVIEGVDETLEESPKDDDTEKENDEDEDAEETDNSEGDDEDEDEDTKNTHQKNDQLENEEMMKSDLISKPENNSNNDEPVAMAMDSKTTEGFSLYY